MTAKDVRTLGPTELASRQQELTEEIFRLRMRRATGQLASPDKLIAARRDLARIKTILRERTVAGGAS